MNGNPFYISPMVGPELGQSVMRGLQYGENKRLMDARMAEQERVNTARAEITAAYESGDPAQMRAAVVKYPQLARGLADSIKWSNDQSREMMKGAYSAIMENPEDVEDIMLAAIRRGQNMGIDMSASQRDLAEFLDAGMTPEEARRKAGTALIGMGELETYDRLSPTAQSFQGQSPEGKLLADRMRLVQQFGEDSPQVRRFDGQMEEAGIDPEFAKEERKVATGSVKDLRDRAAEIRGAYGKVRELIGDPSNLSRQRIAAAIMSYARLVSPGVVTDRDFQQVSGAQDPIITAFNIVRGRDENTAAELERYVDPTNPNTFDSEALLSASRSLIGAEAPVILEQLAETQSRAERAGLKPRTLDTIFGDLGSVKALREFTQPQRTPVITTPHLGPVYEEDIQTTMEKYGMTRDQVLQRLATGAMQPGG